jgi:hypothetical protein
MVAEMRSGQGMRTRALSLVAGQLSHNALPLRPSPPYIIFGMANGWIVETLDATVTAEVEALPADVRGRLNRVVGLIQSLGPDGSACRTSSISRASYGKFERRAGTA